METYKKLFTYENEVNFWSARMGEHMYFIYLGLVNEDLKNKALEIKILWDEIFSNKRKKSKPYVSEIIDVTYDFQTKLQDMITNGIWIGWLSYSFLEHLIRETVYFDRKIIDESYNINDEIKFWLWHHKSEFEASEKLLDPSEINLSNISKQFIEDIKLLEEDINKISNNNFDINLATEEILYEYLDKTKSLKDGIENKEILSNISVDLIRHVIREGERAIEIFDKLQ